MVLKIKQENADYLKNDCSIEKYKTSITTKQQHFAAFINILKACIGSGILSYPSLFQQYGVVGAILYTILFGSISYFGCVLYLIVNAQIKQKYPKKDSLSLSGMSLCIFPLFKISIDVVIVFKCLFVSLSYFTLICETIKSILSENDFYKKTSFALGLRAITNYIFTFVYLVTLPFICVEKLGALKKTSFLGFAGVLLLLSIGFYYACDSTEKIRKIQFFTKGNVFRNLNAFVFSFTCHQNIVDVQNENALLSVRSLICNIGAVYACTTLIYVCFGISNYYAFRDKNIDSTIFYTWTPGKIKTTALIIYVIFLCVTIPLHVNPIKMQVSEIFGFKNIWHKRFLGIFVSFIMFILAILEIANYKFASKLVSQTFSAILVFVLPCCYYLFWKGEKRIVFYVMSAFCAICGMLCFIKTILDFTIWK